MSSAVERASPQRSDQVFQLSLSEIAFTVAFLLLLLLGYVIHLEQKERTRVEKELASRDSAQELARALESARGQVEGALQRGGVADMEEVITKLVAAETARLEREQLKRRVEELDQQLTALIELQKLQQSGQAPEAAERVALALATYQELEKAVPARPSQNERSRTVDVTRLKEDLAISAELRKQIERHFGKSQAPNDIVVGLDPLIAAAKQSMATSPTGKAGVETLTKENSDLRGQLENYKRRLEARGGRDYPPCWADLTGVPQFLFNVDIRPDSIVIREGWSPSREQDARALPGVDRMLANPLTHGEFTAAAQGILDWSKRQNPECRHYVRLSNSMTDAVQSDRTRLMVENFFYKSEVRR